MERISSADDDEAAEINFKLGIGYMREGRFDLAEPKLKKALEFDPDRAETSNALGVLFEELGDRGQALQYYRSALEQAPQYALARMNYGRLLCASGSATEGEQQFLQVTQDNSYSSPEIAWAGAGVCARERSDSKAAERYFRAALEANPSTGIALLEMASLNFEQQRYQEARQFMERYHTVVGYSPGSLNFAIRIAKALGDRQAQDEYQRLLDAQKQPST